MRLRQHAGEGDHPKRGKCPDGEPYGQLSGCAASGMAEPHEPGDGALERRVLAVRRPESQFATQVVEADRETLGAYLESCSESAQKGSRRRAQHREPENLDVAGICRAISRIVRPFGPDGHMEVSWWHPVQAAGPTLHGTLLEVPAHFLAGSDRRHVGEGLDVD
jgi:hypothetical protein